MKPVLTLPCLKVPLRSTLRSHAAAGALGILSCFWTSILSLAKLKAPVDAESFPTRDCKTKLIRCFPIRRGDRGSFPFKRGYNSIIVFAQTPERSMRSFPKLPFQPFSTFAGNPIQRLFPAGVKNIFPSVNIVFAHLFPTLVCSEINADRCSREAA